MPPTVLILGCGIEKMPNAINVDLYGEPDVIWDLNQTPLPFEDNSMEAIYASHVMEHLPGWWACFVDCARILRPGGLLYIHVPHISSDTMVTYRDHVSVIARESFVGIQNHGMSNNAWAKTVHQTVPLVLMEHRIVPFDRFAWLLKVPWLLKFCARHLRNFIWESQFIFRKETA